VRYGAIKRSLLELVSTPPEKRSLDESIQYCEGPSFEDMGSCVSGLGISLGSIELASTYVLRRPLLFIRLREFEIPMCGGVHLVNRFPELLEYFEEDKEMLFFDTREELVDKVRFYLSPERDRTRQLIREKARERAVHEHTWMHRFQKIGEELGLDFTAP